MRRSPFLVLCVLAAACSSSGGDGAGSGGSGSGTGGAGGDFVGDFDVDELFALTEEISSLVAEIRPPAGTPPEERDLRGELIALGQRLVELEGIDSFYLSGNDLTGTAITTDGLPILFINNRPPPEEDLVPSLTTADFATKSPVIPGSRRFVAAAFDGGTKTANDVAALLTEAGYERVSSGASLNAMRNYKDLAVLHLDTHAGTFSRFLPDGNGGFDEEVVFGLQTSTSVAKDTLTNLRSEITTQEILLATTLDDQTVKIAISERFIEKAWSFDRGMVMLHSCLAGAEPFDFSEEGRCFGNCPEGSPGVYDPRPIRQAMFDVGAELIVSFDSFTNTGRARPSMMHVFDRLLGSNEYSPEDPPQRPFDSEQVLIDLQQRGLDQFEMPERDDGAPSTVTVKFFERAGVDTVLAPSIERMDILDDLPITAGGELTLTGLFGPQRGKVKLDGVDATVERWTDEEVVARVPVDSPGAGQVTVELPDGVESNEVPLTEWRGTVTYVLRDTTSSLRSEAEIDLRFRADVHSFRAAIAEPPRQRVVETYLSPASEGTVVGSGTKVGGTETTRYSGGGPMAMSSKLVVDLFAGGGPPPSFATKQLTGLESAFGGIVTLDPEAGVATICLYIRAVHDVTTSFVGGSETFQTTVPLFSGLGLEDSQRGQLACVDASMDPDTYRISSGSRETTEDQAALELDWTELVPIAPPDDDTKS